MAEGDLPKQRKIFGLSFRDLRNEITDTSSLSDFIFINKEIGEDSNWWKFVNWLKDSFSPDTDKKGILVFFSNFFVYIFSRLRVIFVLMSVIADVIFDYFERIKDLFVKKSFWGRGGFLFYAAQTAVGVIVVIIIVASVYRNPAITSANEENLDYIPVPKDDLMAMNASLNTLIPQDRGRLYSEKYIVKRGDTVSSIAKYYGLSEDTILWANDLNRNSYLRLGQELVIPPGDGVLIKIKQGDTVESLAKKYSANVADIVDWNWLESPYTLVVGDNIFIPNGEIPTPVITVPKTSYSYASSTIQYTATPIDPNVGKFLGWPVGGASAISRGFFNGHYGIDFYPTNGRPNVVAAASGKVISAGWGGWSGAYAGYGYYVHIDHGNGYTTLYAHMSKLYVNVGQYVTRGQALGLIGNTGVAYGIHVHFELRRGASLGGRMNPAPYMQ